MVERAKPVIRAIKLTPPRPSARASRAANRRRLCSFRTGAICRYLLPIARACAVRIMPRRYVGRFLAVALTSLLFVGWAVGAPFLGWLSDRIGRRKPPILAGLAL